MAASSVISLQEMSREWTGAAYALCQSGDYTLIPASYGKRFNGHMGVAVAVPNAKYRIVDVNIQRIADSRAWPREDVGKAAPATWFSIVTSAAAWPFRFLASLARFLGRELGIIRLFRAPEPPKPARNSYDNPAKIWEDALNRTNDMVSVRLEDRATGGRFCVSNYHMPCVFWSQQFMTVHTALAAQHAKVGNKSVGGCRASVRCVRVCALCDPVHPSPCAPRSGTRTVTRTCCWGIGTGSRIRPCTR